MPRKAARAGEGGASASAREAAMRGWSAEERQAIYDAVVEFGENEWNLVAASMLPYNRSVGQCTAYWAAAHPLVRGAWTPAEDALLLKLVTRNGPRRWNATAAHIPGRNAKQCRERWVNNLDPDVKHTPWTDDEDQVLCDAQARLGNKWSQIAQLLPGRPDNSVKNRWYCLRHRMKQGKPVGLARKQASGAGGGAGRGGGRASSSGRASSRSDDGEEDMDALNAAADAVLPVGLGPRWSPPDAVNDDASAQGTARGFPSAPAPFGAGPPTPHTVVQLSDPPPGARARDARASQQYSSLPPRFGSVGVRVRSRPTSASSAASSVSMRRPSRRRRRGPSGSTPVGADMDALTAALRAMSPADVTMGPPSAGGTPTHTPRSLLNMALDSPLYPSRLAVGNQPTPSSAARTPSSWHTTPTSRAGAAWRAPGDGTPSSPWASVSVGDGVDGADSSASGGAAAALRRGRRGSGGSAGSGRGRGGDAVEGAGMCTPVLPTGLFAGGPLWPRTAQRSAGAGGFGASAWGVDAGSSSEVARLAHMPAPTPPPPPASAVRYRATLPSPGQSATSVKVSGIAMAVPAPRRRVGPPPVPPPQVDPISPAYGYSAPSNGSMHNAFASHSARSRDGAGATPRTESILRSLLATPSPAAPRPPGHAQDRRTHANGSSARGSRSGNQPGSRPRSSQASPAPYAYASPASLVADSPTDAAMGVLLDALASSASSYSRNNSAAQLYA